MSNETPEEIDLPGGAPLPGATPEPTFTSFDTSFGGGGDAGSGSSSTDTARGVGSSDDATAAESIFVIGQVVQFIDSIQAYQSSGESGDPFADFLWNALGSFDLTALGPAEIAEFQQAQSTQAFASQVSSAGAAVIALGLQALTELASQSNTMSGGASDDTSAPQPTKGAPIEKGSYVPTDTARAKTPPVDKGNGATTLQSASPGTPLSTGSGGYPAGVSGNGLPGTWTWVEDENVEGGGYYVPDPNGKALTVPVVRGDVLADDAGTYHPAAYLWFDPREGSDGTSVTSTGGAAVPTPSWYAKAIGVYGNAPPDPGAAEPPLGINEILLQAEFAKFAAAPDQPPPDTPSPFLPGGEFGSAGNPWGDPSAPDFIPKLQADLASKIQGNNAAFTQEQDARDTAEINAGIVRGLKNAGWGILGGAKYLPGTPWGLYFTVRLLYDASKAGGIKGFGKQLAGLVPYLGSLVSLGDLAQAVSDGKKGQVAEILTEIVAGIVVQKIVSKAVSGKPAGIQGAAEGAARIGPIGPDGEFHVTDWSGYPAASGRSLGGEPIQVPRPSGPFRVLGDSTSPTYAAQLAAKTRANSSLHRADPSLSGRQIHEVHPVKLGGDPVAPANKIVLDPAVHSQYTGWWNSITAEANRAAGK